MHRAGQEKKKPEPYRLLAEESVSYFEKLKEKGEKVYIDAMTYEEFGLLTELGVKKRFSEIQEKEERDKFHREEDNELRYGQGCQCNGREVPDESTKGGKEPLGEMRKLKGEDTVMNRLVQWKYSKEQKEELHRMMDMGMPKEDILAVFYPETDVGRMREIREMFHSLKTD